MRDALALPANDDLPDTERFARVFCPYDVVTLRRKLRGRNAHRVVKVKEPVFPRYIFFDTYDVSALRGVRGVVGVVCAGREPLEVPERQLAVWRDLAAADGLCNARDLTRASLTFKGKEGDSFELTSASPFFGMNGTSARIVSLADLDRCGEVKANINMLGREHTITFQLEEVGRITPQRITTSVERRAA